MRTGGPYVPPTHDPMALDRAYRKGKAKGVQEGLEMAAKYIEGTLGIDTADNIRSLKAQQQDRDCERGLEAMGFHKAQSSRKETEHV